MPRLQGCGIRAEKALAEAQATLEELNALEEAPDFTIQEPVAQRTRARLREVLKMKPSDGDESISSKKMLRVMEAEREVRQKKEALQALCNLLAAVQSTTTESQDENDATKTPATISHAQGNPVPKLFFRRRSLLHRNSVTLMGKFSRR